MFTSKRKHLKGIWTKIVVIFDFIYRKDKKCLRNKVNKNDYGQLGKVCCYNAIANRLKGSSKLLPGHESERRDLLFTA